MPFNSIKFELLHSSEIEIINFSDWLNLLVRKCCFSGFSTARLFFFIDRQGVLHHVKIN